MIACQKTTNYKFRTPIYQFPNEFPPLLFYFSIIQKSIFMTFRFSRCFRAIFILSLFFMGCKKSGNIPGANYTALRVLEFKTNAPITDADVVLEKCTHPDPYGCLESSVVGRLNSDKDGIFKFDPKLNVYLVSASHTGYWSDHSGGNSSGPGDVYLTPVAYTKIHLKKLNAHTVDLLLRLVLHKDPAPLLTMGIQNSYDLPVDTTIMMESYGNYNNSIAWYFTDKAGTVVPGEGSGVIPSYYINRFDTATAEVDY